MTDHVPVEYWPARAEYQRGLVTEICQACSEGREPVPAVQCELAAAVLQRTAYGACPLGCGAVGGHVEQSGDLAGLVRLWLHVSHRLPYLQCIGSHSWTMPLPLAAPPQGERDRLAGQIPAAPRPHDLDDDGYPLTLFL